MDTERLHITTGNRRTIVDITDQVASFVSDKGDGLVNVSLPHATAGLVLMELGSGSEEDLMNCVESILPTDGRYRHAHGSPGHGASHVLPAFITPTLTLPVFGGRISLGTWQSIALIDVNADNPRREIVLAFVAAG